VILLQAIEEHGKYTKLHFRVESSESPIGGEGAVEPTPLSWIGELMRCTDRELQERQLYCLGTVSTHIVWSTKYRYTVLGRDVGNRCRELLREIARSKEMTIYAGSINRDHVE